MSDQLKTKKASDFDADQEIDVSPSANVAKEAKSEPSIFLQMLESVLISRNRCKDEDEYKYDAGAFDKVLSRIKCGDIRELNEAVKYDITAVDNFWDSIGYSLLEKATEAGLLNIVKVILKYAEKSILIAVDRNYNPLLLACLNKHMEIVKLLLNYGVNPNLMGVDRDEENVTCLTFACREEALDLLELLLKHGADPNLLDYPDEIPPLVNACINNRINVVKPLLDYGANIHSNNLFGTPLIQACRRGYLKVARLLLDRGANVNLASSYGDTPLISAVRRRPPHTELIQLLLEHGADPTIADRHGKTALEHAVEGSKIAQMLINAQLEPVLK